MLSASDLVFDDDRELVVFVQEQDVDVLPFPNDREALQGPKVKIDGRHRKHVASRTHERKLNESLRKYVP